MQSEYWRSRTAVKALMSPFKTGCMISAQSIVGDSCSIVQTMILDLLMKYRFCLAAPSACHHAQVLAKSGDCCLGKMAIAIH